MPNFVRCYWSFIIFSSVTWVLTSSLSLAPFGSLFGTVSEVFKTVYDDCYSMQMEKILQQAAYIEGNLQSQFLNDIKRSVELCDEIYSSPDVNSTVLSRDITGQVDCICVLDENDPSTLWVVIRGTATPSDVLLDLSWALTTLALPEGYVEVPFGVFLKSASLFSLVVTHLEALSRKTQSSPIKRVCFTGHSLGGAIAAILHTKFRLMGDNDNARTHGNDISKKQIMPQLHSVAFTVGSPWWASFPRSPNRDEQIQNFKGLPLVQDIHNIVYQLDPVPRSFGRQASFVQRLKLSDYIPFPLPFSSSTSPSSSSSPKSSASAKSGEKANSNRGLSWTTMVANELEKLVGDTNAYHPVGRFYCLRSLPSPSMAEVADPEDFLTTIADNPADMMYALLNDHKVSEASAAMDKLLRAMRRTGRFV